MRDTSVYKSPSITYHMKGTKVLVEVEKIGNTVGSGIIQMDETLQSQLQLAHKRGIVRAIGSKAWFDKGEVIAKVGDKVIFRRYSGDDTNRTVEGNLNPNEPLYRIMEDECIQCAYEENQ
jgi:co-chaperonin GroES (HSP10)